MFCRLYSMMQLVNQTYYSGIGKRRTNEDFVFPERPSKKSDLYLVCDGMGGAKYGELASKLAGLAVNAYLDEKPKIMTSNIKESIHHANNLIQQFTEKHPNTKGMGTTIAMLAKGENALYAAWVGDSRIYQIREGKVIFQSKDHSYLNYLLDNGLPADAKKIGHFITQALNGNSEMKPSIQKIIDIELGDYFVLLTDGVLEGVSEKQFPQLFDGSKNNDEILKEFVTLCDINSRDNHTLYILKTEK